MNLKKILAFLMLNVGAVGLHASDGFWDVDGGAVTLSSSGSAFVVQGSKQMNRLLQKIHSQKSDAISDEIHEIVLPLLNDYRNATDDLRAIYLDTSSDNFSGVLHGKILKILEDLVEPYLRKVIIRTQGTEAEDNARYLLDEIIIAKNGETMSLNQAQSMLPRFLLSVSKPSEDEFMVMNAALGTNAYQGFFEKDVWKSHDAYEKCVDEFEKTYRNPFQGNSGVALFYSLESEENKQLWIHEQQKRINQHIDQNHPVVPFMVPNTRFFHTALVSALKLYNLDPVSLPGITSTGTAAHGVDDLTWFALYFHDRAHSLVTNRNNVLETGILDAFSDAYYNGKDIQEFGDAFMPLALSHHTTLEDFFRTVLERHLDGIMGAEKMNDGVQKRILSESLAGLFLAMNEHMGWNRHIYDTRSVQEVLDTFINTAKNQLDFPDSWADPRDDLETSPMDGTTNLTDQEIIARALEKSWINPEGALDISVERNRRFITITAKKDDGIREDIRIATLYHKVLNSQDNITLFKYAGTDVSAFEKTPQTREDALKHLAGIHELLKGCLDGFCATSREFLDTPLDAENPKQTIRSFYENKLGEIIEAEMNLNPQGESLNNENSIPGQLSASLNNINQQLNDSYLYFNDTLESSFEIMNRMQKNFENALNNINIKIDEYIIEENKSFDRMNDVIKNYSQKSNELIDEYFKKVDENNNELKKIIDRE